MLGFRHQPDCAVRMNFAVGIDHCTSRIGRRLYSSIARFEAAACVARRASSYQRYGSPRSVWCRRFTEFTRPFKDAPGNVERLLKQFCVGYAGENDSAVAMFLATDSRWISVSIAKARTEMTKNPTRNVGLIANILLGSIIRLADQHAPALSAHKVTQEQICISGSGEQTSCFRLDGDWRCACRTS